MDMNRVFDLAASIVTIALITALILPNRRTIGVIRQSGRSFSQSIKAAQGRN